MGFEHPAYPIGCEGASSEEVVKKYPLYLRDFIEERLNDNLAPFVEKATKGHGGKREKSGSAHRNDKGTNKTNSSALWISPNGLKLLE